MEKGKAKNIIYFVLGCVLVVLLFIALIRTGQGALGSNLTFTGLLNFLSNSPSVIPPVNISNFLITADWFVFNWLRDFFNIFAGIFGIVVWIGASILNIFAYLFYFIQFIFAI